jgi:hypothetical protein
MQNEKCKMRRAATLDLAEGELLACRKCDLLAPATGLPPSGTETIALDITPELLAFSDINMKFLEEPGEFENAVGNSSRAGDLQKVILTVR